MTDRCTSLHAYVDGELDADEATRFEAHLASCEPCNAELPRLLALLVALDGVADAASPVSAGSPRLTLVTAEPGAGQPGSGSPGAGKPRRAAPTRPPGRRPWWIATGLASAAALAAGAMLFIGHPPAPDRVSLQDILGSTRVLEARLSYPGTEAYRPLDPARGAEPGPAVGGDRRLQLELSLEHAKNWHGLAVASLLGGNRPRAAQMFALVPATPQVNSDRAALELAEATPAALERALEDVDRALAVSPNDPPALWNRALALAGLNLPLAAAREFDRVAALGEAGWADEARTRAAALRAAVAQRRTRWKQADDAGQRLVEDGTPVPAELLGVTGILTTKLYEAVRSAPSRSRIEALLPLARALDGAYRSDHLTTYVRRVAASNFQIRTPLAESYRELVRGRLTPAATATFLAQLDRAMTQDSGLADIKMGAMLRTGQIAAHLDDYRRLAAASQDPWFTMLAEEEAARAEMAHDGMITAERWLREALDLARRERQTYRVLRIKDWLVTLYRKTYNLGRAHEEAQIFFRDATSAGESVVEMSALTALAAIEQDRYAFGLARAYLGEILERTENATTAGPSPLADRYNCATNRYALEALANISLASLDPERARAEISRSPGCASGPTILGTLVRAELYRFNHRGEDLETARNDLAKLYADPTLTPAQEALLAFIDGDLVIDIDRTAGRRSLREAITKADHHTDDYNYSVKARAYSFALLALDSGRASEFADVIAVLAENLEVARPERCALAVLVLDQSAVVAFSDARGEIGGQYIATRKSTKFDVSTLVPADIVDRLHACDRVDVLTRPPVLGAGRLLPPNMAWSYRLKDPLASGLPPDASAVRRVVVANPVAPPDLNLPALGPYPDEPSVPGLQLLRGADATPSRVLQAMHDASVIEFHTHGFIASDVSEASYLVLSPELNRQFEMTASDVSRIKLDAAPLVILGACHAAMSSQAPEGGIGLAEAFLRSGARAVVASPDTIQDLDAHGFFAAVRERVLHGADPAVAVRDERLRRLTAPRDDAWVSGVVVFE